MTFECACGAKVHAHVVVLLPRPREELCFECWRKKYARKPRRDGRKDGE